MTDVDRAIKAIIRTIRRKCKFYIKKATFDKTYQGRITQILSNNNYEVEISGARYPTYSIVDSSYKIYEGVWVTAPQNDFDSIYIIGRRN